MVKPTLKNDRPHFFLFRSFLGVNDLLIIFNTKRCRYQCHFCQLPLNCSEIWISGEDILAQFKYVMDQGKHSLSILDCITISNDGSILDPTTFDKEALLTLVKSVQEIRRIRMLILETRMEFVNENIIKEIQKAAPRVVVNILTGFETLNPHIKEKILLKKESLEIFRKGVDLVAKTRSELTCYVLYKPSPQMSDYEAYIEAEETIDYLVYLCKLKEIPLTIRLNPMYLAKDSNLTTIAHSTKGYKPPRLTDVMKLAEKKSLQGIRVYIGLSTEGLDEAGGSYMYREDYSSQLLKKIKLFNDRNHLDWNKLSFKV